MNLYRSFVTVGGLTMISRVLGFVRDILIAAALGTGPVADSFFVAFRFPNLFRRLFAEGAFNAAFVPLFAKRLESEGPRSARQFAEDAMAVLLTALLLTTAIAEIAMPWLMFIIAPGFYDTPDKFDLAVLLTRIAFPYLLCMSLVALLSGVLNAMGKFAVAAAAPIILNVVLISVMMAAIWLGFKNSPNAGIILAWGVSAAGLLQLITLYAATYQSGLRLGLKRPRVTQSVRRLIRLGIPGVIAGGITQLNILIGTIIASLQDGAVSYLYYADRIYQLPLGVVGIAIGIVLLPDLSRRLGAGDLAAVNDSQNRSLEFSLLLTLPAAVALFMIPEPIIRVLFERGVFTWTDTEATSAALAAFAWGLPAFVLIKVFSPGFFAREDTKTPMIFAAISMLVNVVGSLLLFTVFGHVGIALATSISGWINALLLGLTLSRRGQFEFDEKIKRRLPRIVLSSVIMGAALWISASYLMSWMTPATSALIQSLALGLLILIGFLTFMIFAHFSGAAHIPSLLKMLFQKQQKGKKL